MKNSQLLFFGSFYFSLGLLFSTPETKHSIQ